MQEKYEVRWYVNEKKFKKKIVHNLIAASNLASEKKDSGRYKKVIFERTYPPRPRLIQEI